MLLVTEIKLQQSTISLVKISVFRFDITIETTLRSLSFYNCALVIGL